MRCKRCNEDLEPDDFRRLRLQYTGVCKACEAKEKYECELRAQERRREQRFSWERRHMRILPSTYTGRG